MMLDARVLERLNRLAHHLTRVEASLDRSIVQDHGGHIRCDEWCKLWMFLVGTWYSLRWSAHGLASQPLHEELRGAHAFAGRLLTVPESALSASDINAWFAGYFLISGEHRIASNFDRLSTLFFWPRVGELEKAAPGYGELVRIDVRYRKLLEQCPHCKDQTTAYLGPAHDIVRQFADRKFPSQGLAFEEWLAASPLGRTWERVNVIKHKRPDTDAVSDIDTRTRWLDAASALGDLIVLFETLVIHWRIDRQAGYIPD
jgi:hypothetical protein